MGVYGFFISGPATSAYVMTRAKKGSVTLTYTMLSGSWWFGYILSPGLGGYLSTLLGMQGVFFLAFVFYLAATGVLFFLRSQRVEKPATSHANVSSSPSHRGKIVLLSLFFAAAFFFLSLVRPLVVQLFQDVHQLESLHIGVLGSIGFLGSAFFSIGIGRFGDRFGKMKAATVSLLITSLSFGLFVVLNQFAALSLASLLNGASYTIWPLMGASVGSITPEASRGRWISVAQMSATLAGSVAPYIGGIVYESSPYAPFYIVAAISPLLALIALTKPFKESKTS
jgi:MFS family permease